MSGFSHTPVLLQECMSSLQIAQGATYVDGTLGGGGHAQALLELGARVVGIDRDMQAIRAASARLAGYGQSFTALHGNYADMGALLGGQGIERVQGVLLDLGVSSHQLDTAERGFSFHEEAPLDMRMDTSQGITAADVLNESTQEEIAQILWAYGEERWAARIAQFIVQARPLTTTMDLVRVIDAAVPKAVRRQASHPARRSFQAIRIQVNGELAQLEKALDGAMGCLEPGGRLVVITFHSLEDRIVKNTMRRMQNPCTCPPKIPMCICGKKPVAKVITRKPILPSDEELTNNTRAHSAKLRCAQRLQSEGE